MKEDDGDGDASFQQAGRAACSTPPSPLDFAGDESPYFHPAKATQSTAVRFSSPVAQDAECTLAAEGWKLEQSILNEFMPTKMVPAADGQNATDQNYSERLAGWLFKACLAAYLILSFVLISAIRVVDSPVGRAGSIYNALVSCFGWYIVSAVGGFALSLAWLQISAAAAELITYLCVFSIPSGWLVLGYWLWKSGGWGVGFGRLHLLAVCSVIMSAVSLAVIRRQQAAVRSTVEIVQIASTLLKTHPSIYKQAAIIQAGQVMFSVYWLLAYTKLLLVSSRTWTCLVLHVFCFGVLLWSMMLMLATLKYKVGLLISHAYARQPIDSVKTDSEHFGALCLSSLLVSAVKGLRIGLASAQKTLAFGARRLNIPLVSTLSSMIEGVLLGLEGITERYTDYTIYWMAHSGDSFWSGSLNVLKLLRRNALMAFTTDYVAWIMYHGITWLLALVLTFAYVHYSSSWVVGGLFGVSLMLTMQMPASILTSAIDAVLLQYALDVDNQRVRNAELHMALSLKFARE